MATEGQTTGHASGHMVDQKQDGDFIWAAHGPGGTREEASTEAEARAAAQAAEAELKHFRTRES